jgi:hypothetical protein
VNDALGDALMVEMEDLFAKDELFQQRRPARAGLEAVLIVGDADALVGRQVRARRGDLLTGFAADADRRREIFACLPGFRRSAQLTRL